MIDRQELSDFARELSLALNVVEKDYVLGWLLAGISAHDALPGTGSSRGEPASRSATSKPIDSRKTWTSPSPKRGNSMKISCSRRFVRFRIGFMKRAVLRFRPTKSASR